MKQLTHSRKLALGSMALLALFALFQNCGTRINSDSQLQNANPAGNCNGYAGVLKDIGSMLGGATQTIVYNGQTSQVQFSTSSSAATSFLSSVHQAGNGVPFNMNVCFTGSFVTGTLWCDYYPCPTGSMISLQSIQRD